MAHVILFLPCFAPKIYSLKYRLADLVDMNRFNRDEQIWLNKAEDGLLPIAFILRKILVVPPGKLEVILQLQIQ